MVPVEQIRRMMTEIGPLLDLAAVAEYEGGSAWGLITEDETHLLVEYDEAEGRLVMSCELARPSSTERLLKIYELLLVYNGQWQETGGTRMSLEAPGGPVIQSLELGAAELDVAKLARVIEGFLDVRGGWQEILSSEPGGDAADDSPASPPSDFPKGGIRV